MKKTWAALAAHKKDVAVTPLPPQPRVIPPKPVKKAAASAAEESEETYTTGFSYGKL